MPARSSEPSSLSVDLRIIVNSGKGGQGGGKGECVGVGVSPSFHPSFSPSPSPSLPPPSLPPSLLPPYSDYNLSVSSPEELYHDTKALDGVGWAVWHLVLAMIVKAFLTIFTFGIKVSCLNS